MYPIIETQKTRIKMLQKCLGIDNETYREMLFAGYGVNSCTALTRRQAKELIDAWEKQGKELGVWTKTKKSFNKNRYHDRPEIEGMASNAQLRKLEAMWKDVSRIKDDEQARRAAFNTFLSNHFGVDDIIWVESNMAGKIITTLEKMKAQKVQKEDKCQQQ